MKYSLIYIYILIILQINVVATTRYTYYINYNTTAQYNIVGIVRPRDYTIKIGIKTEYPVDIISLDLDEYMNLINSNTYAMWSVISANNITIYSKETNIDTERSYLIIVSNNVTKYLSNKIDVTFSAKNNLIDQSMCYTIFSIIYGVSFIHVFIIGIISIIIGTSITICICIVTIDIKIIIKRLKYIIERYTKSNNMEIKEIKEIKEIEKNNKNLHGKTNYFELNEQVEQDTLTSNNNI